MPELAEPLTRPWRDTLRAVVLDHALHEHRTRHLALLHVRGPSGEAVVPATGLDPADSLDHTLRVDVLAALLRRTGRRNGTDEHDDTPPAGETLIWLTRCGALDLQDVDAAWVSAAEAATHEAGIDLTMVVVNRHGWRDPRTGAGARWRRLRRR